MKLIFPFLAIWLAACTSPALEYQPLPAYLIPPPPTLPTIPSSELRCLSDDAYILLVQRDRILRQYGDELRALLGK